jgi:hypothetical protein
MSRILHSFILHFYNELFPPVLKEPAVDRLSLYTAGEHRSRSSMWISELLTGALLPWPCPLRPVRPTGVNRLFCFVMSPVKSANVIRRNVVFYIKNFHFTICEHCYSAFTSHQERCNISDETKKRKPAIFKHEIYFNLLTEFGHFVEKSPQYYRIERHNVEGHSCNRLWCIHCPQH